MYLRRNIPLTLLYFFTWRSLVKNGVLSTIVYYLYHHLDIHSIAIPWLPVSLVGTALAFFVGFKNNSSYDRQWEARKIWGSITNLSRSFTSAAKSFILLSHAETNKQEAEAELKTLVYRHLAWLYALKHSMWQRTQWEHQKRVNTWYRNYFDGKFHFANWEDELSPFLSSSELTWLKTKKNGPVQLLDKQSEHLQTLKNKGLIDNYRHMELQKFITELYAEEGKTERIKNTPLPRQYAATGFIFTTIFTVLLPFGMVKEFANLGDTYFWLLIPFNMIVGWVFDTMETVGDYSENPFEGLAYDTPIYYIIRNIEIDLKDMIGEKNLPEKIQPVYDTLL